MKQCDMLLEKKATSPRFTAGACDERPVPSSPLGSKPVSLVQSLLQLIQSRRTVQDCMSSHQNHLGQPIGGPLPNWKPPPWPPRETLAGRFCRLEPLDPRRHTESLFRAYAADQ